MSARISKRISTDMVAPLIVTIRGHKTIKDVDLARLFGLRLRAFYDRIGDRLWRFKSKAYYKLSAAHDRGRQDRLPSLAFTQAGVLMIAGVFADNVSLEIGMDIAQALKKRRRASAYKKRPARRATDADKASRYHEAKARLVQQRLHEFLNQKKTKKTYH